MNLTAARGGESDWQLQDFIINWKWYEHALDSIDVWGLGVEKVEDRSLLRTSQPYQNAEYHSRRGLHHRILHRRRFLTSIALSI